VIVSLTLVRCDALPREWGLCGLELLRLLREKGAAFLPLSCFPDLDPCPERRLSESGAIGELLGVEHPLLGKPLGHEASGRPRPHGSGNLTFTGPDGSVSIAQYAHRDDPATWPPLAESLWRFGSLIRPDLEPDYAYLDELGRDDWTDVWELDLKFIFWKNVFGRRYVERYGRDFFLGAPGTSTELVDGSVEYSPVQDYLDWVSKPTSPVAKDAVTYFRQKFPEIRLHRARPLKLPFEVKRMIVKDDAGIETVVYRRAEG